MLALLLLLFCAGAPALAAFADPTCIQSCGAYSTVLGYCDGLYGPGATLTNYTYANAFVACLCAGHESSVMLGNGSAQADYGICQNCTATPAIVAQELSQLLTLCTIQAVNGTAAGATVFTPIPYTDDGSQAGTPAASAAARAARVAIEIWGVGMAAALASGLLG